MPRLWPGSDVPAPRHSSKDQAFIARRLWAPQTQTACATAAASGHCVQDNKAAAAAALRRGALHVAAKAAAVAAAVAAVLALSLPGLCAELGAVLHAMPQAATVCAALGLRVATDRRLRFQRFQRVLNRLQAPAPVTRSRALHAECAALLAAAAQ
jgi:hypothetical protein